MNRSPHVLLVNDPADINGWVADLLRQNGFRVSVAGRAGETDPKLSASEIDVLVLDVRGSRPLTALRADGKRARALCFAGWTLDLSTRRLHSSEGTRVPLTGREFDLLVAFCRHAQRVLTREQLLDFARAKALAPGDRRIDVQVSRLRRKIEKDPKDPLLIQTVRSGGYIFTAEVASL